MLVYGKIRQASLLVLLVAPSSSSGRRCLSVEEVESEETGDPADDREDRPCRGREALDDGPTDLTGWIISS